MGIFEFLNAIQIIGFECCSNNNDRLIAQPVDKND